MRDDQCGARRALQRASCPTVGILDRFDPPRIVAAKAQLARRVHAAIGTTALRASRGPAPACQGAVAAGRSRRARMSEMLAVGEVGAALPVAAERLDQKYGRQQPLPLQLRGETLVVEQGLLCGDHFEV